MAETQLKSHLFWLKPKWILAETHFIVIQIHVLNVKVLYCSSGAVYGQQPQNVSKLKESDPLISLESMTREKRVYALGKRYAEESINELSKFGYKCAVARCFAFYGKSNKIWSKKIWNDKWGKIYKHHALY